MSISKHIKITPTSEKRRITGIPSRSRSMSSEQRNRDIELFLIKPTEPDVDSTSRPQGALLLHQLWK